MTGGTALVESMHGAGSPQAQKVRIQTGKLEEKEFAKNIAGIREKKDRE